MSRMSTCALWEEQRLSSQDKEPKLRLSLETRVTEDLTVICPIGWNAMDRAYSDDGEGRANKRGLSGETGLRSVFFGFVLPPTVVGLRSLIYRTL
jgi:hypothetical protein